MKALYRLNLIATLLSLFCVYSAIARSDNMDLSGPWNVRLDPDSTGEAQAWHSSVDGSPISLPSTVGEAGLGSPLDIHPALTKEVFEFLHQRHKYIGQAWFSRSFKIPADWTKTRVTLMLERVLWKSDVWVNSQKIGSQNSLVVPHRFDISDALQPGDNTLVIRIDNSMQVDIGTLGHAYTEQTQSIWNGIIGRIELERHHPLNIHTLQLAPRADGGHIAITVQTENQGSEKRLASLRIRATPLDQTKPVAEIEKSVSIAPGHQVHEIHFPADTLKPWSEFQPQLYTFTCELDSDQSADTKSLVSGILDVDTKGRLLMINGKPSFMRGTLECTIFPKTGYPPTELAAWNKIFETIKEYGLNHVRFHSWCPPEAAFASADRLGIYLQPELPNWTFKNGQDKTVDAFLEKEGQRIMREYAHHPSFVFFSMGNELTGDYAYLDGLVSRLRKLAPHLLYTSTSYSFSERGAKEGPEDDFFITQRTNSGWVRGQGFINTTWPTTHSDYAEGMSSLDVPLITHEVGQYNVYPNLAELPKYDGNLRALNFEAIKQDLESKGRLEKARDYTLNSGKLAVILYKEDIERALRTKDLSGIQLLNLNDFPGQSTATVGILDAFWESKGLIDAEDFREFSSPIVPLLKMPKMAWNNTEIFTGDIEIANFSETPLANSKVAWRIKNASGKTIAKDRFTVSKIPLGNGHDIGRIEAALDKVAKAAQLTVEVALENTPYKNSWSIWVYPQETQTETSDVLVVRRYGKPLFDALAAGKNVLFLPSVEELKQPLAGRFIPVFWSPLHFPNQAGSLGALVNAKHPAFKDFPTNTHTDWQWWELLASSTSLKADSLGPAFEPVMQFIDKYNRNAIPAIMWEAKIGQGKLFVCTLDIESDPERRIVARQLKSSLLQYTSSHAFEPALKLSPQKLASLFQVKPYRVILSQGSHHPNHAFGNIFDGKPETFWHSDWGNKDITYPYAITFEMKEELEIAGIKYLPRQNTRGGRIADYRIESSEDGNAWSEIASGSFSNTSELQEIRFDETVSTLFIRLTLLSEVSGSVHASIAEIAPILDDGNSSVDDLGLIDGFNN